jgi:hypothetical protein
VSSTQTSNEHATQAPSVGTVDTTLEVVVIPVSDVDGAKRLCGILGCRLDADFTFDNTSSFDRATWQAWRSGLDIEGEQPVERHNKLARYFSGYGSRSPR